MPRAPQTHQGRIRAAVRHLRQVDPKLARVIDEVGPCKLVLRDDGTHFDAVSRAIVYQQLSTRAAATILRRFHEIYGSRAPTPAEILATPDETLRAAGLSGQKLGYMKDLARRTEEGLPIHTLHELDDAAIVEALTAVKGVGRWTAQMFLLFRLGRPDVLPDLDLGVQKGLQKAYGLRKLPTPKDVLRHGKKWSPYSSVAAWYLWRYLDGPAA